MGEVQFVLRHPDDRNRTAILGCEPERGVYAEVEWAGVPVVLGASDVEPDRDAIEEIIAVLSDFGFLPSGAVDELRVYLDTPSCWRRRSPARRVRRVLAIVRELERAAG